ncbi:PREDICTED: uncharacterized protein LOC109164863 [Ipomoea nil]|uniref:uncharacterized protein LOC109164863 n=1 Tax=Ipomoea nil TaxID=35883 RepID=UPI000901C8F4|nr:PREDICTED: uncharacterized protein LOC109164863 [Ipomoea nil]
MGPDNFRNIKAEKAKAIQRFRRMQMVTAALRFLEFCMFLGIVCRVSAHLNVAAFKLSGEYFRGLSGALISPRFVFVVGNAIFIVLFLQSGHSPEKHGSAGNGKGDFHEEYMKQSGNKNQSFYSNYNGEMKKQVKQTTACTYYAKERRIMQRSQSEKLKRLNYCGGEEAPGRELRRSATSVSRRKSEVATEEMSSEAFRRKVEDFIARQQRALREEEELSVFGST